MNKFGEARYDEVADKQCDFAFSTAVCIGFKMLLRYDDLCRCRWDKGFCEIFPTHIRFYTCPAGRTRSTRVTCST